MTPYRKIVNDILSVRPSEILDRTVDTTARIADVALPDTDSILKIFTHFRLMLAEIQCKEAQRERLTSKFIEESMYICIVCRYFQTIGHSFESYNSGSLDIPLLTTCLVDKGLIVTPKEISETLFLDKVDYQTYLLVLLRLVDVIQDYTTSAIIQCSMGANESDSSIDYTIAVINLQIVSKLQSGFQLLDLKNDILRKRYDGLKYASQRLNKIVYDLTLRNLISIKGSVY